MVTDLPPPQRRALDAALGIAEAAGSIDERLVAFAFLSALKGLAEERRLLLGVDDLQWLDEPSLALLRYALPRLGDAQIAALLTVRGAVPSWLSRQEGVLELELGPLSVGAVHELLRGRLDAEFPRPVLLRIWETSGGNPFFALELARALQRRGGRIEPGAELPVPETLEDLVVERLQALSPEADDVCRVVAASAEPTVQLVELAVEHAAAGIDDALQARVLEPDGERLRFTHPLLASAISARTIGERKRSLTSGSLPSRLIPRSTRATWHSRPRLRAHGSPRRSTPRRGMLALAGRQALRPSSRSRPSLSRRPLMTTAAGIGDCKPPTFTSRRATSSEP